MDNQSNRKTTAPIPITRSLYILVGLFAVIVSGMPLQAQSVPGQNFVPPQVFRPQENSDRLIDRAPNEFGPRRIGTRIDTNQPFARSSENLPSSQSNVLPSTSNVASENHYRAGQESKGTITLPSNRKPASNPVVLAVATEPVQTDALHSNSKRLPIPPPGNTNSKDAAGKPSDRWGPLVSMVASLAVVLGLFLGLAWMMRKSSPRAASLPTEVVQVIGRSQIAPRQSIHVIRFGRKLILVSNQAGQTQTLSEITDELEVDRLSGLCEQKSNGSISNSFRQVFQQIARNNALPTDSVETNPNRKNSLAPYDYIN